MKYEIQCISFNFLYKYFLLIILLFILKFFLIIIKEYHLIISNSIKNSDFENQLKTYTCIIFNNNSIQDCFDTIFNNLNYFNEINEIPNNITLLIDLNKTNIENLLLLIGTIPFLKNNSVATYNIKNPKTFNMVRKIFKHKSFPNISINIKENDFILIKNKIINLLNYEWEIIPNKKIINLIRYILGNYYDESNLILFEELLNLNFKYYLNSNKFSFEDITKLMSKFY